MAYNDDQYTTHFGNRDVPVTEKSNLVAGVFRSVAPKYDLMNDLMSFGLHRYWKKFTLNQAALHTGDVVLDVASGTGDLAKAFAKMVGPKGQVVMTDINEAMLHVGLERLADEGIVGNITCVQADAENLPFADNHFDCITIAFGLRNVTDQSAALRSMFRVLKPGGKLLILEFSKPTTAMLNTLYDFYSLHIIPRIGEMVAHDKASYQYLVESIRKHPDQLTLKSRIEEAGFEDVAYFNLSGGIVALHQAYKY